MTLQQVADRAGTHLQNISRIERGVRPLTEVWMRRIAPALDVQPADLLEQISRGKGGKRLVKDATEQKWLDFWRGIGVDDKLLMADVARRLGYEILSNKTRKRAG